jgi:hypothetical protein
MSDKPTDTLIFPSWLEVPSHPSRPQSAGDPFAYTIPDNPPPARLTDKDRRDLQEQEFAVAFDWVINRVANGGYVTWALQDYHLEINPIAFRRWIMKDPQRKALYQDARECNADWDGGFLAQLTQGVDRNGIPYDPAFINAASSNLKWKMSKHDRKQYGDVKQIDVSGGISVVAALAEAQNRVIEGRAIAIEEEITELLDAPESSSHEPNESDEDE